MVIDAGYRGQIIVALHNSGNESVVIDCGERIAQLVIIPCLQYTFDIVENLNDTDRGNGGFGSTGTN